MSTDRVVPAAARPELLGVYLNDHLAGSAGGAALARRVAASHRGTAAEDRLTDLARQITEDRDTLVQIMARLGLTRTRYKELAATVAERVGRLKLNGSLLQRSPLSSVVELEAIALGVAAKLAGWRSLRQLADSEPRLDAAALDELIARGRKQQAMLERLRVRAVTEALAVR